MYASLKLSSHSSNSEGSRPIELSIFISMIAWEGARTSSFKNYVALHLRLGQRMRGPILSSPAIVARVTFSAD